MTRQNKIHVKNIYYMLSYAFLSLKQSTYESIETEEFDNIQNLFAAILSKGISRQLKQGLFREYVSINEDLAVMRGKIDMTGTINNKVANKRLLSCGYDELSENNLLNQIIKATVKLLLLHADVKIEYKSKLKKEMLFFADVDTIQVDAIPWATLRFQRNNHSYRMLIGVCQLIIEGMLLSTKSGVQRLSTFVDEQRMHRLYEKFILEYYKKEFPQLAVSASQISWALDEGDKALLPVMKTDITITDKERVLIIDAKYYSHTTRKYLGAVTLHSNNLYQIFTYVKNKAAENFANSQEVSGLLLYARTDDEIQPDNTYLMSGNSISVRTLDLYHDFSDIKRQLNLIIEEHFGVSNCISTSIVSRDSSVH